MANLFEVEERLYRTEDDRIVPAGDPDARWLYAVPGRLVPMAEAEGYGLVEGAEPEEEQPLTRSEVINALGEHAWVQNLIDAGFASLSALEEASDEELEAVQGVGAARVDDIREALEA